MMWEFLANALIVAGLVLLGGVLAAPDRLLPGLPIAAGGLAIGLWLLLLQSGGRKQG